VTSWYLELDVEPMRLLSPSPFRLSPQGAQFDGLHLAIRSDELFARCSVDADGNLAGNLTGTLDALLLRILLPDWEPVVARPGSSAGTFASHGSRVAEVRQARSDPGTRTILSGVDGPGAVSTRSTRGGLSFHAGSEPGDY
jgi:hypothetical protein